MNGALKSVRSMQLLWAMRRLQINNTASNPHFSGLIDSSNFDDKYSKHVIFLIDIGFNG